MKLIQLKLENFKGTKFFTLDLPGGANIAVYGNNYKGKTTLADAYYWLLLGKNSEGKSDFKLKTHGTTGLDYAVGGVFVHNGQQVTLRRVLKENWVRKNGEDHSELKGHKTEYFINDVPKGEGEYKKFLTEFMGVDEKTLYLLTDPRMFSEKLKDAERRDILLERFAADLSDQTILNSQEELKPLLEKLGYMSIDDYTEKLKSQKRRINQQLEAIPNRIDEAERAKPEAKFTKADRTRLKELLTQKLELEQKIQQAENGETSSLLRERLSNVKEAIAKVKLTYTEKFLRGNDEIEKQAAGVRSKLQNVQEHRIALERKMRERQAFLDDCEKELADLRKEWVTVNAQNFSGGSICPACGQTLPANQIEEAEKRFRLHQAKRLNEIEAKAGEITQMEKEFSIALKQEQKRELPDIQKQEQDLQKQLEQLSKAIITPPPFEESREYAKLAQEQSRLESELQVSVRNMGEQAAGYRQKLVEISSEMEQIKQREAAQKMVEAQEKRMEELKEEERKLGIQLSECEHMLTLAGKFVTVKAEAVEDRVNQAFQSVRWKLFEQQVNGGIKPCCKAMVHDVDYANLSNSEKINAGLDIIQGLGKQIGFQPPVWVDNGESTTSFLPIDAQLIRLNVSEKDEQLRVEVIK